MNQQIRYEAWTRYGSVNYVQKFPIKGVVSSQLTLDMFGESSIELPLNDIARINEILFIDHGDRTNDEASIIRAFIGEDQYVDFFAREMEIPFGDTGRRTVTVSGGNAGTLFDRIRVRQYDWSASATKSVDPDWIWGTSGNNLTNPGFEDSLIEGDAESGTIGEWKETSDGPNTNKPFSLEVLDTSPRNGSYHYACDPLGGKGSGMEITIPIIGGEQYVFQAWLQGTVINKRYTMAVELGDGSTMNVGQGTYNGFAVAELDGAAYGAGVSTLTYQALNLTITFGADVTETTVRIAYEDSAGGDGETFYMDDFSVTGPGLGLDPWELVGFADVWEIENTIVRSGSYSMQLQVNASSPLGGTGVRQKLTNLIVGKTYTWGAYFRHDGVGNEPIRLVAKRPAGIWKGSQLHQIPAGATWTWAYVTFVADSATMWLDFRYDATGASPNIYMDDGIFGDGFGVATVGEILNDLLDDASFNHLADNRAPFVNLARTFTDTLDSSGAAWDEDIAIRVRRGQTYRSVIEDMERLGYEFRMSFLNGGADWRLDAFNPGNMGTDYSTADGPAILSRPGILSAGPIIRREPRATYTMAEGEDYIYDDYRATTLESVWGEIEEYQAVPDALDVSVLTKAATEYVTSDPSESLIITFMNHTLVPGIDFVVGDILRVTLGESVLPSSLWRVMAISAASSGNTPRFQVEFEAA